jgi:AICAR transformylase/IMP cyclohydrolase PurH
MTDMVNSDFEKMRVELRYTHDKVTNSQRLDMSLERGRIRDDLLAQNAMMGQIEKRLDREMQTMQATHSNEMQIMKMTIEAAKNTSSNEIQNMRTTIEVAKSDTLKYGIGAVLSAVGLGLGVARFLG